MNEISIMGKPYKISYVTSLSDVDINKRDTSFAQVDFISRTIRIYRLDNPVEDVFDSLIHEIIEVIVKDLEIEYLEENHDKIATLSTILADTLVRNGIVDLHRLFRQSQDDLPF